jgi:hypothetical protein
MPGWLGTAKPLSPVPIGRGRREDQDVQTERRSMEHELRGNGPAAA